MLKQQFRKFADETSGAMTAFGLFMLMACVVMGGLALDVANAYKARTQLQATADNVAHAALYSLDVTGDPAVAKTRALRVAESMMPKSVFGVSLTASDITFGNWDSATRRFQPDPTSDDAVMVDMGRMASRGNPLATQFLSMAGIQQWDVRRGSVYETYRPTCMREGMVADSVVDVQSNNEFTAGFCIHSNTHVEVNQNNNYELGVIVSMPDERDVVVPSGDMSSNTGLAAALRDGAYQIRMLTQLPSIVTSLEDGETKWAPSYITSSGTVTVSATGGGGKDMSDFTANRINSVTCVGNQRLRISANTTLQNVLIITNCEVTLGNNVMLQDAAIVSSNTDPDDAIKGSHVSIGYPDNCTDGGGGALLTMGGISFSSDLDMHGGQMIAMGNISFAARASGIKGASIIAGGTIDTTSLIDMGFCGGSGMDNVFEAEYFRMAS